MHGTIPTRKVFDRCTKGFLTFPAAAMAHGQLCTWNSSNVKPSVSDADIIRVDSPIALPDGPPGLRNGAQGCKLIDAGQMAGPDNGRTPS